MTVTFQTERFADIRGEIEPLLEMHYREVAHFQDIPLAPDWTFYCTSPVLRVFTARQHGELVGYAIFGVGRNKHYTTSLQAVQDVLFISPTHRLPMVGYRFIRYCDEQLRLEGVQAVYQHVKGAHNFGPLLERQGYEEIETIYAKRLDKE